MVRETRTCQLTTGVHHLIDIRKTTEILHQHEVIPSAEEEKLSFDCLLLLKRSVCKQFEIFKTHVTLADSPPCAWPQALVETILCVWLEIFAVEPSGAPAVEFRLPAPEVTLINLIDHVIVDIGADNLVVTPVEGVGPIAFVKKRYVVVEQLHKTLEVGKILVRFGSGDV